MSIGCEPAGGAARSPFSSRTRYHRGTVLRLSLRRPAAAGHSAFHPRQARLQQSGRRAGDRHPVPRDGADTRLCRPADRSSRRQALGPAGRGRVRAGRAVLCHCGNAGLVARAQPRHRGHAAVWPPVSARVSSSPAASPGRSLPSARNARACRCPGPASRCSRHSPSARRSAWRSIRATACRASWSLASSRRIVAAIIAFREVSLHDAGRPAPAVLSRDRPNLA